MKCLLIISVLAVFWLLGNIEETALGMQLGDLKVFAPPSFIFSILAGPVIFILITYIPYLFVAGGFVVLIAWWKERDNWRWNNWRAPVALAAATSAFSLFTGIGSPLLLTIAATLIYYCVYRIFSQAGVSWIDAFRKIEILWLTIAFVWLLPASGLDRLHSAVASRQT